jgi:hypothetical protein
MYQPPMYQPPMYQPPIYRYPRTRDYTTSATVILILYLIGWVPGFIANLFILLGAAWMKDAYDHVEGFGCLVWLLIVCGFGPIAAFAFAYFALLHLY